MTWWAVSDLSAIVAAIVCAAFGGMAGYAAKRRDRWRFAMWAAVAALVVAANLAIGVVTLAI